MDLNAARMFVAVVQAGSISAAATKLSVPLPTLSRRIRELERELNIRLLERSVRGVILTESGARLYEHASRGVEAFAEGEQKVLSDQSTITGRLRLSLPPNFEAWWALLAEFQQQYPEVDLRIYSTERRVDLIADGIDVALRVGTIQHETMVARRIISYRHILVASQRLIARCGMPQTPQSLDDFPCAAWSRDVNSNPTWQLGDQLFEPKSIMTTNDYAHLCHRALAGEVVTELPPFLAIKPIRNGELVPLLPTYPFPEVEINLLYPSHRHPSSVVTAYLNFWQRQCKSSC